MVKQGMFRKRHSMRMVAADGLWAGHSEEFNVYSSIK